MVLLTSGKLVVRSIKSVVLDNDVVVVAFARSPTIQNAYLVSCEVH